MRISTKQKEEIEFLSKYMGKQFVPTQAEIENYINITVNGEKITNPTKYPNPLFQAKRRLDMTIKSWRKDMNDTFFAEEAKEDFNFNPYICKILDSINK